MVVGSGACRDVLERRGESGDRDHVVGRDPGRRLLRTLAAERDWQAVVDLYAETDTSQSCDAVAVARDTTGGMGVLRACPAGGHGDSLAKVLAVSLLPSLSSLAPPVGSSRNAGRERGDGAPRPRDPATAGGRVGRLGRRPDRCGTSGVGAAYPPDDGGRSSARGHQDRRRPPIDARHSDPNHLAVEPARRKRRP